MFEIIRKAENIIREKVLETYNNTENHLTNKPLTTTDDFLEIKYSLQKTEDRLFLKSSGGKIDVCGNVKDNKLIAELEWWDKESGLPKSRIISIEL